MKAHYLLLPLALGVFALESLQGQAPVILQATKASATPATVHAPAAVAANDAATKNMIQLLHSMQATNTDTIKKQEAALETLDGLQKAAEEIKIFSKRG